MSKNNIEFGYEYDKKDFPKWLKNPETNELDVNDLLKEIDRL